MNIIAISPVEIVTYATLILMLYIISVFLASKKEKGLRLFIWLLLILLLPILGPLTYIINFIATIKLNKNLNAS